MLDRNRARMRAHVRERGCPRIAVVAEYPDLEQFMGFQGTLDFDEDRRGEAVVADHDDRLEWMGPRLQSTSRCWCERLHQANSNRPGRCGA